MIHMQGCRSYSNFQRALIYIYNHRGPRCLAYRNAGCTSLPFKFSLVFQLCLIEFVMLLLFTMSPNRKKCWSWSKFGSMLMHSTHYREFFFWSYADSFTFLWQLNCSGKCDFWKQYQYPSFAYSKPTAASGYFNKNNVKSAVVRIVALQKRNRVHFFIGSKYLKPKFLLQWSI